jgi:xylan 1,4-beta-xylosidase
MGFMPKALSTKPEPYMHEWRPGIRYDRIFTGWAYPPKDYGKWGELCHQWAKHCVERYGKEEVEKWYWQTWNEANIGYWRGTPEEFYKLHDYAVAGVLRALPTARVGGPDTAGWGGDFARKFYEHNLRGKNHATGKTGSKLDFVSFHAKGSPKWQGDFIRMGIANQLREVDRGFGLVASFPELKDTPIVIGESDPEGCAACQGDDFAYRNGTMYSSYTAASFARKHDLANKHGVNFEGALSWSFTFEDQPYFAGFRQMASNGIDMPVFNVMRMFSKMDGERVKASSSGQIPLEEIMEKGVRDRPDIGTLASARDKQIAVMVWHYHDDDLPGPNARVTLDVDGFPDGVESATLTHYRVDYFHSNSYSEWQRMGSPMAPNEKLYAQLEEASKLTTVADPAMVAIGGGKTAVNFELPRQGVSLLLFTWD